VNLGLLLIFLLSSLNVYGLVLAGWSSNSKYALLGALRAIAQMISYEIVFGTCVLIIIFFSGSANLTEIVLSQTAGYNAAPLLPVTLIFFICIFAETNRAPFDLPEAESEIVAGYNVEYSSITFAMFFLAEYSNMILMSTLFVVIFFGG
jgi:NADH-quinone oxidoreductase subunit H